MDQRRLILFLVFAFSIVMLWEGWVKHNQPAPGPTAASSAGTAAPAADASVPTPSASLAAAQAGVP
ncbi:MAG: membrane protein insertase YidC, partial [Proteobacteria bacterium]|nr:membrane protein insertase YidC [Pseudomonadota bacterium]